MYTVRFHVFICFFMWNHTIDNHSGYNININGHNQCASITLQGHWTSLHTHFITWSGGSCGISCWYLIGPWNHTVHNQAHGWWVPLQMFASLHASQITWFQDAWNSYVIAWFCKLYIMLYTNNSWITKVMCIHSLCLNNFSSAVNFSAHK